MRNHETPTPATAGTNTVEPLIVGQAIQVDTLAEMEEHPQGTPFASATGQLYVKHFGYRTAGQIEPVSPDTISFPVRVLPLDTVR